MRALEKVNASLTCSFISLLLQSSQVGLFARISMAAWNELFGKFVGNSPSHQYKEEDAHYTSINVMYAYTLCVCVYSFY